MGRINAENLLKFKSSKPMFDRISKKLSSLDAHGLIDTGDFHKHVIDALSDLGQGVFKECEALIEIENKQGILPLNFKTYVAAYKCSANKSNTIKSINEQRPVIYYMDTEITKECPNRCCVECVGIEGKTKVVIRTFVNGEDEVCTYKNPVLLSLSPNVRIDCDPDSPSLFCKSPYEITIDDRFINVNFDNEPVYIQYYGLPIGKDNLPQIPDETVLERFIEYYITKMIFEAAYWNSSIPNIERILADVRVEESYARADATRWVNLPSFQKMLQSIKKTKGRFSFYNSSFDRTRVW